MKQCTYNLWFSVFFLGILSCFSQDRNTKIAKKYFEDAAYQDAITSYEKVVEKGYASPEIFENLANANYFIANYEEAVKWFEKLYELDSVQVHPNSYYRHAQSIKSLKNFSKYDESDRLMEKFNKRVNNDGRVEKYTLNKDYLMDIEQRTGSYTIKRLNINSKFSDFAPSFYGEKIVFASARDAGLVSTRVNKWNNVPMLNLYMGDVLKSEETATAELFGKGLNSKIDESSSVFTKDGKTVYFTRNNSNAGKNFLRDKKGFSRLKIFRAELVDNQWTNVTELPFNDDSYSVAHPTLSKDETKLFFASDMPGTHGDSDIWVVEIFRDGGFGTPMNLGPEINTEGRETFPFMTRKGVLYFSSDGHPGLGGLDVFATPLFLEEGMNIINLGKPINSYEDDFSFIINDDIGQGYFASNRPGGFGEDDVYSFTEIKPLRFNCLSEITGVVKSADGKHVLENADIHVFGPNGVVIAVTSSDENGEFEVYFKCKSRAYSVVALKKGFKDYKHPLSAITINRKDNIALLLMPE